MHGLSHTKIYNIWGTMVQRCHNPKRPMYKYYGGRGIQVCSRWKKSFLAFYKDMGNPPAGLTLERRNNKKGYSRQNCYWASKSEQQNNKQNNRLLIFRGKKQTLNQWANEIGMTDITLRGRLQRNWSLEDSILTPVRFYKPRSIHR